MSKPLVCVTGATGFLASHLVQQLLSKGSYRVRGTVRSLANEAKLTHLRSMPGADERLELVEADLLVDGSFDEAVKGCDGVFHTASPFFLKVEKDAVKELIEPAQQGTLNLLRSAIKEPSIRRVVLTSSTAAVVRNKVEIHTEDDWNDVSTLENAPYPLSKKLAEQSAWEFVQTQNPKFTLSVINPCMILGPVLTNDSSTVNTSSSFLLGYCNGEIKEIKPRSMSYVDVRDVAAAHIAAYENPDDEAVRSRFICIEEIHSDEEMVRIARDAFPQIEFPTKVAEPAQTATAGLSTAPANHVNRFDNTRIRERLGVQFRPFVETVVDSIQSYKDKGLF